MVLLDDGVSDGRCEVAFPAPINKASSRRPPQQSRLSLTMLDGIAHGADIGSRTHIGDQMPIALRPRDRSSTIISR
jgi:hypothetical protein